jgi:hypothetical protein
VSAKTAYGHVCQNPYQACEAVGCVTCAIVDYNQKLLDRVLNVDGEQEFVVYLEALRCLALRNVPGT